MNRVKQIPVANMPSARTLLFVCVLLCLLSVEWAIAAQPTVSTDTANARPGTISGELRRWHRMAITFDGPNTNEGANPNPFTDYRLDVTFTHIASGSSYIVPGFYAADGNAANTSSTSGNKWRVYFSPDRTGDWLYEATFTTGDMVAVSDEPGNSAGYFDGESGSFAVQETNKGGNDFRGKGRLVYVNEHYLRFAGTGEYYIKSGINSPENLLAYHEFDGTFDTQGGIQNENMPFPFLHHYSPHVAHWTGSDPTWASGKGKGIIGLVNYLANNGVNSVYFLTYNVDGGDGHDTWPWTGPTERYRFDVSKLDQWEVVFSHMTQKGVQIHMVTQETENDWALGTDGVSEMRALYYRELAARFAHNPVLQWNVGEENGNTNPDRAAFGRSIRSIDPYDHPVALHSYYDLATTFNGVNDQGQYYYNLINTAPDSLDVASMQGDGDNYNGFTIDMRQRTASAGHRWVMYGDEQGPAVLKNMSNLVELMRDSLWGTLAGGGAGVEWYFSYQQGFGDLQTEDFTQGQQLYNLTAANVNLFKLLGLPLNQMAPNNGLGGGNVQVLAKPNDVYLAFLPTGTNGSGGSSSVNIGTSGATFDVYWYDPRSGNGTTAALQIGTQATVTASGTVSIGAPPSNTNREWMAVVWRQGYVPAQLPLALPDSAVVVPGGSVQVNVVNNDASSGGINASTATLLTGPSIGSAQLNNGLLTYTAPSSAMPGEEIILTYNVQNNQGQTSNIANISIAIRGVPLIPPPSNLDVSGSLTSNPVRPTFEWQHKVDESSTQVPGSWYNVYIMKNGVLYYSHWGEASKLCSGINCSWDYGDDLLNLEYINPLLDGEYTFWIGAYVPSLGRNVYSTASGHTFNVSHSNFSVDPKQGRPTISFDDDTEQDQYWVQIYVGNPAVGVSNMGWYDLRDPENPRCDGGRCTVKPPFDAVAANNPYGVWLQYWGNNSGFSSATGYDSGSSWVELPELNLPEAAAADPSALSVTNDTQPIITWNAGARSTWYRVILAHPGTPWWVYDLGWFQSEWIGCVNTGQTCTLIDPVLNGTLPAGDYKLYVLAWGPGGFNPGGISGYMEHDFSYGS